MKKICHGCNQQFDGRRDAKTCTARCRKRLQRLSGIVTGITKQVESDIKAFEHSIESSTEQLLESQDGYVAFGQPSVPIPTNVNSPKNEFNLPEVNEKVVEPTRVLPQAEELGVQVGSLIKDVSEEPAKAPFLKRNKSTIKLTLKSITFAILILIISWLILLPRKSEVEVNLTSVGDINITDSGIQAIDPNSKLTYNISTLFQKDVVIDGDLTVNGNLNGFDLDNLAGVAILGADQTFTGANSFAQTITQNGFNVCDSSNNCNFSVTPGGVTSINDLVNAITLQGTENQINVANGANTIKLSLPQDIATSSSPNFTGLTLTGGVFNLNGDNFSDLTGTGLVFNGGSLETTLGINVDLTSEVIGTLPVSNGGTGATSFVANGLLFGNGSSALQITNVGTGGQVLLADGSGVPTFTTVGADATISSTGLLNITADAVALTTDTTGNYVATITNGSGISGSSSVEGGTPTISLGDLTANWTQSGAFDIVLNNSSSGLKILESTGGVFYGSLDIADLTADRTYTFPDNSGIVCTDAGNCIGGGGGAPNTATYLTVANDPTLTNERAISFDGTNFSVTDGGANGSFSINTIQGIAVTSSPIFTGLTLSGDLAVNGDDITSDGALTIDGTGTLTLADNVSASGTIDVAGLVTLNGGLTIQVGDTLTFNGDAFDDLTGNGLTIVTGDLTVDDSSSTGFFRNGGNSFGTATVIGTNDSQNLYFETNGNVRGLFDQNYRFGVTTDTSISLSIEAGINSSSTYNRPSVGALSEDASRWAYLLGPGNNGSVTDLVRNNNTSLRFATETLLGGGTFAVQAELEADGDLSVDTNTLFVDATNNRVGIGTTTPTSVLRVVGTQPATVAGNGVNATPVLDVNGGAGGDTSGTTGQTAGAGASVTIFTGNGGSATGATGANVGGVGGSVIINSGAGGNVTSATGTAGSGGSIAIQTGAPGTGGSTPGNYGVLSLQASGGRVGIGNAAPNYQLDVTGDINTTTLYRVGGVAGVSTTCSGSTFMRDQVTVGGIVTAGTCANGDDTLQTAYTNSTNPATITTADAKNIVFTLADTTTDSKFIVDILGTGNTFEVRDSGTAVLSVVDGGNVTLASDLAVNGGDLTTSSTTFNLLNTTATTINVGSAATNITLGVTGATSGTFDIFGGSADTGCTFQGLNGNLTCAGDLAVNGGDITTSASILNVDVANGGDIRFRDGTNTFLEISDEGTTSILNVTGSILPTADDAYDLGSASLRWRDLYLGPATLHIGTSATDEGTISYDTTNNILQVSTDSTSNADIAFFTDDLYLDKSSGNIGIGDVTPLATLTVGSGDLFQVAGASGSIQTAGDIAINGGDITSTATLFRFDIGNTGSLLFRDGTNTFLTIADQGTNANFTFNGTLLASNAPTPGTANVNIVTHVTSDTVLAKDAVKGNDGKPVIAYHENTGNDLKLLACSDVNCSNSGDTAVSLDTTGVVGDWPSIAIGGDGFPVISYYDETNTGLKVYHCSNASCSSGTAQNVDGNTSCPTGCASGDSVGQNTSIAIDPSSGFPIVSYTDITNTALKLVKCGNATCSSSNTYTYVDGHTGCPTGCDADSALSESNPSLSIGNDGLPIISYWQFDDEAIPGTPTDDLFVVHCDTNTSCSSSNTYTRIDGSADVTGSFSKTIIGNDGFPIIFYKNTTARSIMVSHCENIDCSGFSGVKTLKTSTTSSTTSQGRIDAFIGSDGLPLVYFSVPDAPDDSVVHCGSINCASGNTLASLSTTTTLFGSAFSAFVIASDGMPLMFSSVMSSVKCLTLNCDQNSVAEYTGGSSIGSTTNYFNNIYGVSYFGKSFQITSFDIAEEYPTDDLTLGPGDVVKISNAGGLKLERSSGASDPTVIGIITTKPAITLGEWPDVDKSRLRAVALVGRTPVKVTDENGPINIGDPITASSTPGKAMRATQPGMIIGRAMEALPAGQNSGLITVFVTLDYQDPNTGSPNFTPQSAEYGNLKVNGTADISQLRVTSTAEIKDLTITGRLIIVSADTAGVITITAGSTTANYQFITPYALKPQIQLTPTTDLQGKTYWVEPSLNGFTVHLSGPINTNAVFNYFIFGTSAPPN